MGTITKDRTQTHASLTDMCRLFLQQNSTPLHDAARRGLAEVVCVLLEAEADPEIRTMTRGEAVHTPLACAQDNGHDAVCQILLNHKK